MRTQELILAELKCRRTESVGLRLERQGLQGQITTLTRSVEIEKERGDFFKQAATIAQSMDKNSQKMDTNSVIIQTTLETRLAEKNDKISELTDSLNSCRNNQKWIAGTSFIGGGLAGYFIRGKVGGITGADRPFGRGFDQPQFRPMPPQSTFELPSILRPASDYLKKQ